MNAIFRAFGRIIRFDDRSWNYNIRQLFPRKKFSPGTQLWACPVHLNQKAEGACTGFAVAHEAAADPVRVPQITNRTARQIYLRAKQLDQYPGDDYEGSSVLGAMKAATEKEWYAEYRWAFSESDLLQAVCTIGPAVIGVDWHEGMMDVDNAWFIRRSGPRVGGHAICVRGYDHSITAYVLRNSWGRGWGLRGDCYLSRSDMRLLLAHKGEACIPLKRLSIK